MAKVYNPPEGFDPPQPDYENYDFEKQLQAEEAWIAKLAEWCKAGDKGDTVGEVIRHGVGDGYAQYMVCTEKPLTLIHLAIGDAWSAGAVWERGIRLADVRRMVANNRNPLFGPKAKLSPLV